MTGYSVAIDRAIDDHNAVIPAKAGIHLCLPPDNLRHRTENRRHPGESRDPSLPCYAHEFESRLSAGKNGTTHTISL
jgi:hypothetical protein